MINLFRKSESASNVSEVIAEIHESFYTEVDRLLAEAKISHSTDTNKQELINKSARLKELGFNSSVEVKEAEAEVKRLNELKEANRKKQELVEAINLFSFTYPQYKFITEDSVKKICNKYGLIYGPVDKYLGVVPDKNLVHIEQFKINEIHECHIKRISPNWIHLGDYGTDKPISIVDIEIEKSLTKTHIDQLGGEYYYLKMQQAQSVFTVSYSKCALEIAAPMKDFDTKNMKIEGFRLKETMNIPDPIVLKPVIYKGTKHYLIVTAWGDEASDESVVNEKMN